MKSIKKYVVLLLLASLGLLSQVKAQSDLQISKVFEQYGEKKGSTMVELSNEMLGDYNFSLFKSITIKNNPAAAEFIRKCLEKDEAGAKKVKQVIANGIPTSIFLHLPRKGQYNRLILFNESAQPESKITLIYIESKNDTEEILKLILKKK